MDSSRDGDSDAPFPELLDFCSRAQTLIAELLLLSDRLPSQFRDPRFDPVLFDLRYFDSPNEFEASIEGYAALEAIEDELRECCGDYMERFFVFVNAAAVYYLELRKYLDDLKEGVYVQCTFGRALENECGLQLLAESMAFFGCLLLLMEHLMSGFTREKLLVAHMRHYHCSKTPNLDILFLLCRAHLPAAGSFSHASSPSFSYAMVSIQKADDLFRRFPFPELVVDAVISRMRDGDIYKQMRHYPDPQHRTVALSLQAGCLYVMLFYSPEFLYNGLIMREIVDRFFKDCWVVPIFCYFSVDLLVSWDAYKEAKALLSSCFSSTFVRDRSQSYCSQVTILLSELSLLLGNGVLTKYYVLDNSTHLLSLVRNCNISLRWQLLHRNTIEKRLKDIVVSVGLAHQVNEDTLLLLLLKSSHLEFEVKRLYAELSEGRQVVWQEKKHHAYDCIQELLALCDGMSASSSKIKNESLKDLLGKFSLETQSLVCTKTGSSGRIIYRIASALKDIDQFPQVEESIQIKQQLSEAHKSLQDMIKVLELDSDTTSTLSTISDAVYAWGYIAKLSELFCKKIEQDPLVLLILHTFFLKFKTVLSAPLTRIKQNQSLDLLCISQYYSSKYEAQICSTLEIVPAMILRIFSEVGFQTGQPFQLLNCVDNDNLHNFMQLEPQLNLAKTVSKVSILSKGIMVMSRNFRGIINLDFNDWLERQIQRQLLKQIEDKLNSFFSSANAEAEKLEANLKTLSNYIFSHSHVMESFQGLLHLNGCHIWEETFTEVLKQCSQREHVKFIEIKQKSMTSPTLTKELPAQTFFGRLLCQILQLTDPSRSMFLEPLSGWFDADGRELLGLHFFDLLYSCVGQVGLASLDSLLRSLLKKNLEHAMRVSKHMLDAGCLEKIHKLDDSLGPAASHPLFGCLSYKQMIMIVTKSWDPWVETLAFIGQLQLLRCLVSLKLKSACKVKAEAISFAAEGMMTSIYSQREMIYEETKGGDDAVVRHFLEALKKQQNLCGFSSPLHTKYITDNPPTCMGRFAFIFSITQLSHYVLDMHLGVLTSRSKKSITDFSPLVIGLGTFLYQFHPSLTSQYLQYMGQYVRITAQGALYEPQKGYTDTSSEVQKSAFWLMYFCKYMGVPKDVADSCLPPSLVAILHTYGSKNSTKVEHPEAGLKYSNIQ